MGRHDLLEPGEGAISSRSRETRGRIEREPNPFTRDLRAVDRKPADVEGHVGEIMIVAGREVVDAGRRVHSSRDQPRWLSVNADSRRPGESASNRIKEDVRAIEESEVGSSPRDGAVDGVGEIFERDAYHARGTWRDLPRLVINLAPLERCDGRLRRELGDAPREPEERVVAGRPRGKRQHYGRGARNAERHHDAKLSPGYSG